MKRLGELLSIGGVQVYKTLGDAETSFFFSLDENKVSRL